MLSQRVERLLPYSPPRLFDLAADVERYPEFLRWWISARIRERGEGVYYTDQVLGLGPIRVSFGSRTVLSRPERIDVTSAEPPFRQFHLSWGFKPHRRNRCRVSLIAALEFRSPVLERLASWVLPASIAETITAFEERADQLYAETDRPAEDVWPPSP
jgi:coenzyme Q-binding protein COQ10